MTGLTAVLGTDQAAQSQLARFEDGEARNRRLAATTQARRKAALSGNAATGIFVCQYLQQVTSALVIAAALDADDALANGGQHD